MAVVDSGHCEGKVSERLQRANVRSDTAQTAAAHTDTPPYTARLPACLPASLRTRTASLFVSTVQRPPHNGTSSANCPPFHCLSLSHCLVQLLVHLNSDDTNVTVSPHRLDCCYNLHHRCHSIHTAHPTTDCIAALLVSHRMSTSTPAC